MEKVVKRAKGKKTIEESRKTQRKIIQTAMKVFARNGYHNASIRKIAIAAEVSHGLLRHYFNSKEELWKAVIEFGYEEHISKLKAWMASCEEMDSIEFLKRFIEKYIELTARFPEFASIIHQYNTEEIPHLDTLVRKIESIEVLTHQAFLETQKKGYFSGFDEVTFGTYLRALVETPLMISGLTNSRQKIDIQSDEGLIMHTNRVLQILFG